MQEQVGFIGAGAMAEAMIRGILQAKLVTPAQLWASDVSAQRLQFIKDNYGINITENQSVLAKADVVILAVKPQVLNRVLTPLAGFFSPGQLLVSIAAGVTLNDLEGMVPEGQPVIRVMPNTPCLVGEGVSVMALGRKVAPRHQEMAASLLGAVGPVFTMEERYLDAVTGLSGSGPAYIFLIIESLTDAGVRVGLPREVASVLVTQTVLGAAKMVKETGRLPADLKGMVTSPGGTTIAGLHALEDGRVRAALMDAVVAATKRARELRSE